MSDSESLSDSDEEYEREMRKDREARRQAKPVKTELRDINRGKGPVAAAELLALAKRHYPHREEVHEYLWLEDVAPRMAAPEITALLALESKPKEWLLVMHLCGHAGCGTQGDLARSIAQAWRTLSDTQRGAIKPHLLPYEVQEALGGPPEVTWDTIRAMCSAPRRAMEQVYVVAGYFNDDLDDDALRVCKTADTAMQALKGMHEKYLDILPAEEVAAVRASLDRDGVAQTGDPERAGQCARVQRVAVEGAECFT